MRAYRILLVVIFEFSAYFSPLLAQDEKSRDVWQKRLNQLWIQLASGPEW